MLRNRRALLAALSAVTVLLVAASAADAYVVSWGQNNHYQLCTGYKSQFGSGVPVPTLIPDPTATVTGGQWMAALTRDKHVWTCGGNEQGQAANGTKAAYKATPSAIPGLEGVDELAGGGEHAGARVGGRVYLWGSNYAGQECDGREGKKFPAYHPEELRYPDGRPVTTARQLAIGGADTLVLLEDGTVLGCGEDHKGQLGDATNVNKTRLVPVAGLAGITAISVNGAAVVGEHVLALTRAGTLLCLGLNDFGQCANGTTANSSHPTAVKGLSSVERIAAGPDHDLAVTTDGTLWAWGQDTYGQLGAAGSSSCGSATNRTPCAVVPQRVPGLAGAGAIASGTHFSLAAVGGRLYSFGQNRYSTLGDGTKTDRQEPTLVAGGLEGVTSVAGGYFDGYAVTTTHVTPEVSIVPGVHSLTENWVSTLSHEPWHVQIRPVASPVGAFGKAVTLEPGVRSHTFTGLTTGQAYEVDVYAKGFVRKIATGVAG